MALRNLLLALALLSSGCKVDSEVPVGAVISCDQSSDCPDGRTCHPGLKVCVVVGSELARPRVAFTTPARDELNVSLTPTLIVVFTVPVDLDSARAHVTLTGPAGDVPLTARDSGSATTLALTPVAALEPTAKYTLDIGAGIAPAADTLAEASDTSESIGFTTMTGPDVKPTGKVTSVTVDHVSDTRVELSWSPPPDADFTGTLVVRRQGGPVTQTPARRTYATGDFLDAEKTELVVAVTHETSFVDLPPAAGAYDYALFAVDTSGNFSAAARAPFVSKADLVWCPSETGSFRLTSPDAGKQSLELTAVPSGATKRYPAQPDDLNSSTAITLLGTGLALGDQYTARVRAENADGVTLGVAQPFTLASAALAPLLQPVPIAIGGTASFGFERSTWPAFEYEADRDPATGKQDFQPDATLGNGKVQAVYASAGAYRLRVRPKVAGCAVAEWVTSDEFLVGAGLLYVKPGGAGPDGKDPDHAFATIGAAMAAATAGTDIRVAGGTYNESVTFKAGVRLYGGWGADFRDRDGPLLDAALALLPRTHETKIAPTGNDPVKDRHPVTFSGAMTPATTVLDQFTVISDATGSCATNATGCGAVTVTLSGGASPTISDCQLRGTAPLVDNDLTGLFVGKNSSPVVRSSTIEVPSRWGRLGTGIAFEGTDSNAIYTPTFQRLHLTAHLGVWFIYGTGFVNVNGQQVPTQRPTFEDCLLEGDPSSQGGAAQRVVDVSVNGSGWLTIRNSRVYGRANKSGPQQSPQSQAINASGLRLTLEGNRISGGDGATTIALALGTSSEPAVIRNNLIFGGAAYNGVPVTLLVDGGQRPVYVTNNVIHAGLPKDPNASFQLVGLGGPASSSVGTFANNLLVGPWNVRFFEENLGVAGVVQNNVLVAGPVVVGPMNQFAVYKTVYAGAKTTTADMETYLCGAGRRGSGNTFTRSVAASDVFVSLAGPDGKIETMDDNDWHLKTTDAKFTQGGLDASKSVCGRGPSGSECTADGAGSCGDVSVDLDGKPRTAPYSVGAYEVD